MNHIIQQPKTSQKQKKAFKVISTHPEIQPNKSLEELKSKEWTMAIQKEIEQFQQAIIKVEAQITEASVSQHLICLGTFKLVQDEYQFAAQKLQQLKEMLSNYVENHLKYHEQKVQLKKLINIHKHAGEVEAIQNLTREQLTLKFVIKQQRTKIQFQFGIAQRILILIQAYIKLKDQHEDEFELQKRRDYILQKIDKIKKTEEKHTKKIEKHFYNIRIEDYTGSDEIGRESEQSEQEQEDDDDYDHKRADLIKLCDRLISYLKNQFEKKEGDQFLQHDLSTFQYFDQIKIAAPFYQNQIDLTIELIDARKSYYQDASDSEFVKKKDQKVVIQQEKKVDVSNEQEFPKLQ